MLLHGGFVLLSVRDPWFHRYFIGRNSRETNSESSLFESPRVYPFSDLISETLCLRVVLNSNDVTDKFVRFDRCFCTAAFLRLISAAFWSLTVRISSPDVKSLFLKYLDHPQQTRRWIYFICKLVRFLWMPYHNCKQIYFWVSFARVIKSFLLLISIKINISLLELEFYPLGKGPQHENVGILINTSQTAAHNLFVFKPWIRCFQYSAGFNFVVSLLAVIDSALFLLPKFLYFYYFTLFNSEVIVTAPFSLGCYSRRACLGYRSSALSA